MTLEMHGTFSYGSITWSCNRAPLILRSVDELGPGAEGLSDFDSHYSLQVCYILSLRTKLLRENWCSRVIPKVCDPNTRGGAASGLVLEEGEGRQCKEDRREEYQGEGRQLGNECIYALTLSYSIPTLYLSFSSPPHGTR